MSFGISLCHFADDGDFSFKFVKWFIPLRWLRPRAVPKDEMMQSWGFTVDRELKCIHFNWGIKYKIWDFPWAWRQIEHNVRRPDGSWVPYVGSWERDKEPDGRWTETYPYTYTLRSGEVQHRTAKVYVEQRKYKWRCLQWLPFYCATRQAIEFQFNDEVGERTGSWKGGCIGSGYNMLPGETPLDTLRRMESERKF